MGPARNILKKLLEAVLDILYPPICFVCEKLLAEHEKNQRICFNCLNSIPLNNTLFCAECRARLPENKKICHQDSLYLLAAAASYNNRLVQKLIWDLKYNRQIIAVHPLAELLNKYLNLLDFDFKDYVIIPIPLSSRRERKRGFNQSAEIAKLLSLKTGLKIINNQLSRFKNTKPQTEMMDWDQRKINIEGCFKIKNLELVEGQKIILLDDVFTSGSTLNEAVKTLKFAGAKKIIGLVVAKV
jgi:ComF family protein